MSCTELPYYAYQGAGETTFPNSNKNHEQENWFKQNGNYYSGSDIANVTLHAGDVIFLANNEGFAHEVMVSRINADKSIVLQAGDSGGTNVKSYSYRNLEQMSADYGYSISGVGQQGDEVLGNFNTDIPADFPAYSPVMDIAAPSVPGCQMVDQNYSFNYSSNNDDFYNYVNSPAFSNDSGYSNNIGGYDQGYYDYWAQ